MYSLKNYKFKTPDEVKCICKETVKYMIDAKPLCHREFVMDGNESVSLSEYTVLCYRAFDLQRFYMIKQPVIIGVKDGVETPVICMSEIITDGKWHRVIAKAPGNFDFLRLRMRSRAPHVEFEIKELYTCSYDELPQRFANEKDAKGFYCIDISDKINGEMPKEPCEIDGGIGMPEGQCTLLGVSFDFPKGIIAAPPAPDANNDIVNNFSVAAKRRLCRPESRESEITIDINSDAKEICFVLALSGMIHERWGFCAPDPTILGSSQGEVMMPIYANDIERFAVLINYEDGRVDECFPYNIGLKCHVITGETGVYALRADGTKVKSVTFIDRMIDTDVAVLAVSVNKTADYITPDPFPQRKRSAEKKFDLKAGMSLSDNILTIKNGGFSAELSISDGLMVRSVTSAYADSFSMDGALLKLRVGDEIIEKFALEKAWTDGENAKITYSYGMLKISVTIGLDVNNGIVMNCEAVNKGEDEFTAGIIFPALNNLRYESSDDTWYFLPKYQNLESNETAYIYEESAPSFPMQFFDIFSPKQGCGLAINTKERDLKVRKYGLNKQMGVLNAFVEYPAMYLKLKKNAAFKGSETVMYVHSGDWRKSYQSYKKWINSWYQPYKCQNKDWYRKKFWLIAEITDFIECRNAICKFPIWYDEETKKYSYRMIMEEQTKLYGATPDILHMWAWTWSDKYQHMLWGNFGDSDYERIGGLENFKNAMQDVRDATGAEISLYMHPTLLSETYPQAEKYFPTLKVINAAGKHISIHNDSFRMCHANKDWRDYALSMYPALHDKTGVKIIYVDEFSLRVENRCYADNHGHDVPSNLLKTDRTFISELKDIMPEDVVLYGEYYAVDVNASYIDCNISYHILDSINTMIEQGIQSGDRDDSYGRMFTDIYRFTFPKIVQLILPMAMRNLSWQPLKSTFFNGEAIYDSFWDAEESRGRKFMAKSFRTKKKYADCFSSDEPETMLDSPSDAICINRYPGNGRTIYTLYNRAYNTYDGTVLELPAKQGDTYYDVWNDCEAEYEIKDGIAYIKCRVTAQNVGCILVESID